MKTYACPHCGLEVVVHSPCSWNHESPACPAFSDLRGAGFDGFATRAAEAFGTTVSAEQKQQIAPLGGHS